jgi:hypothetical protein
MGLPRLTSIFCGCALLGCAREEPGGAREIAQNAQELRPTPGSSADPPTFDRGDKVEQLDSAGGFFRVHYARAGRHAVPPGDTDGSGIPDYVETIARQYDEVLEFFRGLGYREPLHDDDVPGDNGGDGRFDIYLLDFPTSADGSYRAEACEANGCSGYMLLENDFTGRNYRSRELASRLVSSHEFFHAIQHAYAASATDVLAEGTAVWASEAFDAAAGDLEAQAPGYLMRTDRALGQEGTTAVDPFAYGSAIFFQHLDESVGRDAIRELWEREADPDAVNHTWPELLDDVLHAKHDSSLAEVFARFAEWNLYTNVRADPSRGYAHGSDYPLVTERALTSAFDDADVRVFPVSARYYALRAGAAGQLVAAADVRSSGLELLVAAEHDGQIGEVKRSSGADALRAELDLQAGDTFHGVLLNTRSTGESLRPSLCIGSASEVASCRKGHPLSDQTPEEPASSNGGGCTLARGGASGRVWEFVLAAASLCLRRRGLRRRQRGKSTSAQRKRTCAGPCRSN